MSHHFIANENIIGCSDETTGAPTNYYLLYDTLYANQFPQKWAYVHIPGTGTECDLCMKDGTWCGVMIGYCRNCAKLYDGERGPGFISPGIEYDETDPNSANMSYMANVSWRKVGKPEFLEDELRRYYYGINSTKIHKKLDKVDQKIRGKRDTFDGELQMNLAQFEKLRDIRQTAIKKQLHKSIKIEKRIYDALRANESERLMEINNDIQLLEKSIKILELSLGEQLRNPYYWNNIDECLTPLGEEKIKKIQRRIYILFDRRRRLEEIEKTRTTYELNRINAYIECLNQGNLIIDNDTSNNRFYAYNNAVGIHEDCIGSLTTEINLIRNELEDMLVATKENKPRDKKEEQEYDDPNNKFVEWWWVPDLKNGKMRKKMFHYHYSSWCKTEKDREYERLYILGIEPIIWAKRNVQKTPENEWPSDYETEYDYDNDEDDDEL